MCMCSVIQLCPTLLQPTRWIVAHQVNCSPPDSSVHGIFQARILEWVSTSFSKGSFWSRDWTHTFWVSCTAGRFFTSEPLGKPCVFPFYPSNVAVPRLHALAPFFFKIYLFLIGGLLLYNIVMVSPVHQHESVIGIHRPPPSWALAPVFSCSLVSLLEQSSFPPHFN